MNNYEQYEITKEHGTTRTYLKGEKNDTKVALKKTKHVKSFYCSLC